jgi:hypothetical protein
MSLNATEYLKMLDKFQKEMEAGPSNPPQKRKFESTGNDEQCFGTTKSGKRCRKTRRSECDRFCHHHTVPSPFSSLPNEILHKIVALLEPHERMALALTNVHLANTAKQWTSRSIEKSVQPGPRMSVTIVEDPSPSYEFVLVGDHRVLGRRSRSVSGILSGHYFKCLMYTREEWNDNPQPKWTPIAICPTCHSIPGPFDRGNSAPASARAARSSLQARFSALSTRKRSRTLQSRHANVSIPLQHGASILLALPEDSHS